jgi:opacity protein-like surface antigen
MRKSVVLNFLTIISLMTTAALAESNTTLDPTEELGDDGKPLKVKERDGYMPNIITPEYAKSGVYGGLGLGVTQMKATTASLSKTQNMTSLSLLAGYNFNEYLAVESRASISIANDDSINYKNIGLYIKPQYEVSDGFSVYSLLGFGTVSNKSAVTTATDSSKATMQLGVGAGYKLPNNFKVFADYTYLGKDSNAKYKNSPGTIKNGAFTGGITYDF